MPAAPALLAPTGRAPEFTSDTSDSDLATGETVFKGACQYRDGPVLMTADEIRYNGRTKVLVAIGQATLTEADERLLADRLEYHSVDGTFTADRIRVGRFPFYIQGESAEGSIRTEVVIHHASISYTEPGRWRPSVRAETITYAHGHYLKLVRSVVGIQNGEFIPIKSFTQDLQQTFGVSYFSVDVGYRSSLGGSIDLGAHLPFFPGARLGGDVSFYTSRGLMAGPTGTYADPTGEQAWKGVLKSGFISDYGNRLTDVRGEQIQRNRSYLEWTHQQQVNPQLTLDANINWWSDSYVVRDFRPKEFYPVESPDNAVESVYASDNAYASVFARFRPNTWEAVQERLPEVGYHLMPSAIGGGFYQRLDLSAVYLHETSPFDGSELASNRVDLFYGLSYPFHPTPWFSFTPVAGARITDYSGTIGAPLKGGYLRPLGEIGFDSQLQSSGTFNYQNPLWEIDGLRHLLTPIISYRYIPSADKGQQYIPQIDRRTFSTYLQPLDLGDIRTLDQLHPVDTFRLGLKNTLQTREVDYGSRDLLTFDLADDFHLHRTSNASDFSDLHLDMAITPARWLEYDVTEIFTPDRFQLREIGTTLILHDGDVWSLQLANDFLRHEDDYYLLNFTRRLNEQFSARLLIDYNARRHVLDQVAFSLIENLANSWRVEYRLIRNGGPNRDGRFGFQVALDVLRY